MGENELIFWKKFLLKNIMFKILKKTFPEWKNKTVKLMFPDAVNPISFIEKKITIILCIIGILAIEVFLAIALSKISDNIKLVMIAHAVAVLISTLNYKQFGKSDFNAQDVVDLTIVRIIVFNIARGVNYIWFVLNIITFIIVYGFLLLFPFVYGIYLYSLHIFFVALYFYMKKNSEQYINAMEGFADGVYTVIIYICSGLNLPYLSMCGSGEIVTKFGIVRQRNI